MQETKIFQTRTTPDTDKSVKHARTPKDGPKEPSFQSRNKERSQCEKKMNIRGPKELILGRSRSGFAASGAAASFFHSPEASDATPPSPSPLGTQPKTHSQMLLNRRERRLLWVPTGNLGFWARAKKGEPSPSSRAVSRAVSLHSRSFLGFFYNHARIAHS